MIKTSTLSSIIMLAIFHGSEAQSQTISTNELLTICDGGYENADSICTMYIMGAIEGLKWGADASAYQSGYTEPAEMRDQAQSLLGVCDSEQVTLKQNSEVVKNYIRSNPQSWHESAVILIHRALMRAFPCP